MHLYTESHTGKQIPGISMMVVNGLSVMGPRQSEIMTESIAETKIKL